MALKPKALRAMNPDDRADALRDTRQELMHQRGLAAMGGAVKNPGQIRDLRTTIARILTVEHELHDADMGSRPAPRGTPGARPAKAPAKKAAPKAAPKAAAKRAAKAKARPAAAKPAAKPKKPGGA